METENIARSPVTLAEFEQMKASAMFGDEDVRYLRLSHDVLKDHVEEIVGVWYGFIGGLPHLVATFSSKTDGKPIDGYLAGVRKRFEQWVLDTARAEYDQKWLNFQHEIGLRHHREKKNQTDGVDSTDVVPFRHLFPVIFPVTYTLRPYLAKKGHSADEVEKMYAAWVKSCLLQMTLWTRPYVEARDF